MEPSGFFWINYHDSDNSVFSFIRRNCRQRNDSDKRSELPQQPLSPDECLRDACRTSSESIGEKTTDALCPENSNATAAINGIKTEHNPTDDGALESTVSATASESDTESLLHASTACGTTCNFHTAACGIDTGLSGTVTNVPNGCVTDIETDPDMPSDNEPVDEPLLVIANFTPVERSHYKCGVPLNGVWREIFNSDASIYGGQNRGNCGAVKALSESRDGQPYTLELYLPPLSTLILEHAGTKESKATAS